MPRCEEGVREKDDAEERSISACCAHAVSGVCALKVYNRLSLRRVEVHWMVVDGRCYALCIRYGGRQGDVLKLSRDGAYMPYR